MTTPTYYTPEPSDICIGLEIEHSQVKMNYNSDPAKVDSYYSENWVACNVKENNIREAVIMAKIALRDTSTEPKCIRVKHLDREDIEGEGWETVKANFCVNEYMMKHYDKTYRMLHMASESIVGIVRRETPFAKDEVGVTKLPSNLIALEIKNLTEFRKLMKQLGIKK